MEVDRDKLIGQGNTAEIYSVDQEKILKLFRNGLHEGIVEREYQNAVLVGKILSCVPAVYDKVEVEGRTGIVYERICGKSLLQMMMGSLRKMKEGSKKLAQYHLALQRPVNGDILTVKEKLMEDINAVDVLSGDEKNTIKAYLDQLPDGNTLCHFDFHPGNVMIAYERPFILDWMTACKGDVCADVARTGILLKYGRLEHAPFIVKKIVAITLPYIYKIYMKEYLILSGKSMEEITKWELPIMAARLRESISEDEKKILLELVIQKLSCIA